MSTFGEDLIQSLSEALAHAEGKGSAVVHAPVDPGEIRTRRADTSPDGPDDGYEPVGLSEVGARPETR